MKLTYEELLLKFGFKFNLRRYNVSEKMQWSNMIKSWIARTVPAYAEKAKFKDPTQPAKWIQAGAYTRQLFSST